MPTAGPTSSPPTRARATSACSRASPTAPSPLPSTTRRARSRRASRIADLSRDGRLDVITGNTAGNYPDNCCQPGGNTISVLVGSGTGSLASPIPFTVGDSPFAVTTGDLDGDGDRDLATANWHSNNVTVLLNTTSGGTNQPPVPVIDDPAATVTWTVGDVISFAGHATDAEDGTLPASSLEWTLLMQHCPSNCHTHTIETWPGVASGSFSAPDHEYPSHLELRLTATDQGGASVTTSVTLQPQTVDLTFESAPSGLQLTVGATTSTTPFDRTVIVGSANSVSALTPQVLGGTTYFFSSWSDGGAQSHTIVAPAVPTTFTAVYFGERAAREHLAPAGPTVVVLPAGAHGRKRRMDRRDADGHDVPVASVYDGGHRVVRANCGCDCQVVRSRSRRRRAQAASARHRHERPRIILCHVRAVPALLKGNGGTSDILSGPARGEVAEWLKAAPC